MRQPSARIAVGALIGPGCWQRLFDQTVKQAMKEKLISQHISADGTLVRANASFKSFVPIEVAIYPEEYKKRLRSSDEEEKQDPTGPQDPGNPTVDFRGEKRGNKTHRSRTDPDCRFVSKGSSGTGAYPGDTVNALMENRNRILLGVGVKIFHSSTSEERGALSLLDRAKHRLRFKPTSLGTDKGFFHEEFIGKVLRRRIEPHIAADKRGSSRLHMRVRMRQRGQPYYWSRSGVERRLRNSSAKARSSTACDASGGVICTEYGRKPG